MNNQSHRAAIAAPFSAEARGLFQHVLTAPPERALASVATQNPNTGLWVVDPGVVSGTLVNLSDAAGIAAAALLAIAAVTGVQVTAPYATGILGSVSEITALRASTTISTPADAVTMLNDTVAHLGTLHPEWGDGYWQINPLVTEGVHVSVTDSGEISADFLVYLLSTGDWSVNVDVPHATGFKGGANNMANVYYSVDEGKTSIPPGLPVTVTDATVDASSVIFLASHAGVTVRFDHASGLTGNTADVLTVLGNPALYQMADFETVTLSGVSVAGLADALPQVAQYTDAVVKAVLYDALANFVVQDGVTGVWSLKPGAQAATNFQIAYGGPSFTAAAGAVQALIDAVGAGQVYAAGVEKFGGGLSEIKHLIDSGLYLYRYGVALSEATVSAADLIALAARAYFNVEATAATKLSGSVSQLSSVFSDTTIVLSGTENISISTALTVADLATQRAAFAAKTSGSVTAALADSIANLTGHLAEAGGNGYTVVDTLLNVQAGGAVVDGAHGFTIIAGGPATMAAADVLALVAQVGDGALLDLSGVTAFTGSAIQIQQMLASGVKTHEFGVTLSDTTLTTAALLSIGELATSSVAAPAATALSGAYADVLTVVLGGHYVLSGAEAISVTTGLTLGELAELKTHTSGVVTGLLRDSVANLTGHTGDGGGHGYVVLDTVAHLLAGGAVIAGAQAVELAEGGVPETMAAVDVLALVDLTGAGNRLDLSGVYTFTGSARDVLRLFDANVATGDFSVELSGGAITGGQLLEITGRADYVTLTAANSISCTLDQLYELRQHGIDWSSAAIDVTSPVSVAELAALRSDFGSDNVVTGALSDSVAHLTGHLAEAGVNGYSVVDSVAHVLAGGAIVNGARDIALVDSVANLTGHTTAGGATAYSVIDTVAHLTGNTGVLLGHAQAVVARDTVANLSGHTDAGGATSHIVVDSLEHILDAGANSLVNQAASLTLTDLTIDLARITDAWSGEVLSYNQQIDATGVQSVSGDAYTVSVALNNNALQFSGTEQVTLSGQTAVWWANQVDTYTTGAVTASIGDTAQRLVTLTGSNNHYDLTVSDAASVAQLKALDAITTGAVSYGTVVDTAANLAKLVNGAWVVDSQLHANTDIVVIGDIATGALQALRAFNVGGDVTLATQAANHFNIATSAAADYTIAAGEVTNLIDVAGAQTYHVARSDGLTSGGVLNLSGVDGHNTIVFDGYYAGNGGNEGLSLMAPRSYLTMTQSGTTAYFLDAQTHMQVAAISLNEDAGRQYIEYANGDVQELKLVGNVDPVIQLYWND